MIFAKAKALLSFLACVWLLIIVSGCSSVPDFKAMKPHVDTSILGKKTKTRLMMGEGEYQNEFVVRHAEVKTMMPLMEIVIPISKKNPSKAFVLEMVGRKHYSVTQGHDRLDLDESFLGIGLSTDEARFDWIANDKYYSLSAEGYYKLTNLLRLRGGIMHRNSHNQLDEGEKRYKAAEVFAGMDYQLTDNWSLSGEYRTGNRGRANVNDRIMLGVTYVSD